GGAPFGRVRGRRVFSPAPCPPCPPARCRVRALLERARVLPVRSAARPRPAAALGCARGHPRPGQRRAGPRRYGAQRRALCRPRCPGLERRYRPRPGAEDGRSARGYGERFLMAITVHQQKAEGTPVKPAEQKAEGLNRFLPTAFRLLPSRLT